MAFPVTPILDTFTDASAPRDLNVYDSVNWGAAAAWNATMAKTHTGGTALGAATNGAAAWLTIKAQDTEVYCDLPVLPSAGLLVLHVRATSLAANDDGYSVNIGPTSVAIIRTVSGAGTQIASASQTLTAGDGVGLQAIGARVAVWYRSGGAGTWTNILEQQDTKVTAPGVIGLSTFTDTAVQIDNFGGGLIGLARFPTRMPLGV